ncbi:hypothetical protein [Novosphingobium sp.]|uniref:hypothetical protein n=1 Tax=Novosphingobium sp. TaxID=1874826 RepID=UPI0038B9BA2C
MQRTPKLPPELVKAIKALAKTYGADTVRDAVASGLPAKDGRPQIDDLTLARPLLEAEAEEWRNGADLKSHGRQQRMANAVGAAHPGHNLESTIDRVRHKLAKKRIPAVVMLALPDSIDSAPIDVLLRKVEEAYHLAPSLSPLLDILVTQAEDTQLHYRALIGEPDPDLSLTVMLAEVGRALGSGIGAGVAARRKVEADLGERASARVSLVS